MRRIVFMGTPDAAVPTLEALATRFDVQVVITQPDRPRGRSGRPEPSAVKSSALELGLHVSQPASADALHGIISESEPFDLGVVVAYGRIIRPEVLAIPEAGMLNVHFSLLPRWRGAAPVNRAVMSGDPMTGVTVIQMDAGLDTGPVLTAQAVDIDPKETAGELTARLSRLGARLLTDAVEPYLEGELNPVPQSDEGLAYAQKIEGDDRPLALSLSPRAAADHVRGLAPSPSATLDIDGVTHKVLAAEPSSAVLEPGTWKARDGWPVVGLHTGALLLLSVQAPGKKPMPGDQWARGKPAGAGSVA